jgi:hypothetical protein
VAPSNSNVGGNVVVVVVVVVVMMILDIVKTETPLRKLEKAEKWVKMGLCETATCQAEGIAIEKWVVN